MIDMSKLRIAVLFGGRSGEHEVSLTSAKSVLSVLDPKKYEVFEVGITHDGAWLTGPNARQAMEDGNTGELTPCTILPDPSRAGLFGISKNRLEKISDQIGRASCRERV